MLRHCCATPDLVERRTTGGRAECQNYKDWPERGSEKRSYEMWKDKEVWRTEIKMGKKEKKRGEEWKLIWGSGSETQAAVSLRVTLGYTAMMSPHAGTVGLRNRLAIWSLPLILVPVSSFQLTQTTYWDSRHADLPLSYSPLLSHTSILSSMSPPFPLRSESAVSPSPVYVTVQLLAETKNAPQCVNKPSFKEIELYGDKRCPWAWVQITDWSDTADSLCFVN